MCFPVTLNSAVRIAVSIFPESHPNIAESLTALAIVSARLGLDEDADNLFREAAKICEKNCSEPLKLAVDQIEHGWLLQRSIRSPIGD